jgi:hypothetical protein
MVAHLSPIVTYLTFGGDYALFTAAYCFVLICLLSMDSYFPPTTVNHSSLTKVVHKSQEEIAAEQNFGKPILEKDSTLCNLLRLYNFSFTTTFR